MHYKKKISVSFFIIASILLAVIAGMKPVQTYAADKTPPEVELSLSTTKATKANIKLQVTATDASGIKSIKAFQGKLTSTTSASWKKATDITKNKYLTVKENGVYSVLIEDKAGNRTLKRINIKNIDNMGPDISTSMVCMQGEATTSVTVKDTNGIKSIHYLNGAFTDPEDVYWKTAVNITGAKEFKMNKNGYYTILATDKVGNKSVYVDYAQIYTSLNSLSWFNGSVAKMMENIATDCMGNEYRDVMLHYAYRVDSSNASTYFRATPIEYYLNHSYRYLKGIIGFYGGNEKGVDSIIFKIYADDELIYFSDSIDEKTEPINFNIEINDAKFLKIVVLSTYTAWTYNGSYSYRNQQLILSDFQLYR